MTAEHTTFYAITTVAQQELVVPYFQRGYVWKSSKDGDGHLDRFWDTLLASYDGEYTAFLDSIIVQKHVADKNHPVPYSVIIDGQQRLTTFSIMLRVIGEKLDCISASALQTCLVRKLSPFNTKDDKVSPRISHSRLDKNHFNKIMCSKEKYEPSKDKDMLDMESNIVKCYQFFIKKIDEFVNSRGEEKLENFLNKMIESPMWVLVSIEESENPQRIFDTINNTGQRLTSTDIIKNCLFDKFENKKNAEKYYDEYWGKIFDKQPDKKSFWGRIISVGKVKTTMSENFLHRMAVIEGIHDPDKHRLEDLSSNYKKEIDKNNTEEKLIEFLELIKNYAEFYRELIETYEKANNFDKPLTRFLYILNTLKYLSLEPILLCLYKKSKDKHITEKNFELSLKILETYIVRRFILKLSAKRYNKFASEIIYHIKDKTDVHQALINSLRSFTEDTNRMPSAKEIKKIEIEKIILKAEDAKLFLYLIESYLQHKNKEYQETLKEYKKFHVEHLIPQKWEAHWSADINELLDEENKKDAIEKRNKFLKIFGNLTLTREKLNNEMKNYEWKRKLQAIQKHSNIEINEYLKDKEKWDEEEVSKRTKILIDHINAIWNIDL